MSLVTPRKGYKSVPWLFGKEIEIPDEWDVKKFHKICSVPNGQVDPKKQPFCDMKHIGQKNIEKNNGVLLECFTAKEEGQISGKYLFNEKHILYGKINPNFAKVAFPKFSGICSADMYPIDCKEGELIPKFLFYCLLSTGFIHYTISVSDRTGIPKINRNELDNSKFIIPSVKEQQKIASILSNVDNLIESTRKVITHSKSLKKGLMQKLLTRGIGHTKFKSSTIGTIPKTWFIVTVKDIAKVKGGKRLPKGEQYSENKTKYPYLRIVDFVNGSVNSTHLKYLNEKTYLKIKNYFISFSDVYLTIVGNSLGLAGIIPEKLDGSILTENSAKLTQLKQITKNYLYLFLNSKLGQTQIESYCGNSAKPKLALYRIEKIRIPLPPLPEQQQIASILSNVDTQIELQTQYKEKLQRLKKSLMQKLLTGEVRV